MIKAIYTEYIRKRPIDAFLVASIDAAYFSSNVRFS